MKTVIVEISQTQSRWLSPLGELMGVRLHGSGGGPSCLSPMKPKQSIFVLLIDIPVWKLETKDLPVGWQSNGLYASFYWKDISGNICVGIPRERVKVIIDSLQNAGWVVCGCGHAHFLDREDDLKYKANRDRISFLKAKPKILSDLCSVKSVLGLICALTLGGYLAYEIRCVYVAVQSVTQSEGELRNLNRQLSEWAQKGEDLSRVHEFQSRIAKDYQRSMDMLKVIESLAQLARYDPYLVFSKVVYSEISGDSNLRIEGRIVEFDEAINLSLKDRYTKIIEEIKKNNQVASVHINCNDLSHAKLWGFQADLKLLNSESRLK
jgi:hypothetical protein